MSPSKALSSDCKVFATLVSRKPSPSLAAQFFVEDHNHGRVIVGFADSPDDEQKSLLMKLDYYQTLQGPGNYFRETWAKDEVRYFSRDVRTLSNSFPKSHRIQICQTGFEDSGLRPYKFSEGIGSPFLNSGDFNCGMSSKRSSVQDASLEFVDKLITQYRTESPGNSWTLN